MANHSLFGDYQLGDYRVDCAVNVNFNAPQSLCIEPPYPVYCCHFTTGADSQAWQRDELEYEFL